MHVVIGGAFHGKSEWVKTTYGDEVSLKWFDLNHHNQQLILPEDGQCTIVVIAIETLTKEWSKTAPIDCVRKIGKHWIQEILNWENQEKNRKAVVVGTDFSKGIVPVDETLREWRDVTGWFYQDLIKAAERVDQVWYGINTTIK